MMFNLGKDAFAGILRHFITFAAGIAVALGMLTPDTAGLLADTLMQLIGAFGFIAGTGLSIISKIDESAIVTKLDEKVAVVKADKAAAVDKLEEHTTVVAKVEKPLQYSTKS